MTVLRRLVVSLALATALLGLAGCGDDDGEPDAAPTPSSTPAPTEPTEPESSAPVSDPAPTRASPEEFCEAFRAFAAASNEYVANANDTTGAALVAIATKLASLDPVGLSEGGQISLDQLVNGSLDPLGEKVEVFSDALPDQAAFDEYLNTRCPA